MIADRTCRAVSFLAARVKSRLRFAAHTGHKARQSLAHPAFRPSTVKSGGFCVRSSPRAIASHSAVQDFYFGPDFLLRRHDYELEVTGGLAVAQYVHDFVAMQGIRFPSRRRVHPRGADMRPDRSHTLVWIDLSDFELR